MRSLGQYKKESKEKLHKMSEIINKKAKELESLGDIHYGALRLSKNNAFIIDTDIKIKRRMAM